MHQSAPLTLNSASPFPSAPVSTEQIQKYLDENKSLILAILESQNLGKLAECAQYQAVLQQNLMYLAAIADAQPNQTSGPSSQPLQTPPSSVPQQAMYMHNQPPQATMAQQQQSILPKMPFQLNSLPPPDQQNHLLHFHHHQQQQQMQGNMGFGSFVGNGMVQPGFGNSGGFQINKQGIPDSISGDPQGMFAFRRGSEP